MNKKSLAEKLSLVEKTANELLVEYNLSSRWRFVWISSKMTIGECDFKERTIALSSIYVEYNRKTEWEDVLRHEIAHAIAGNKAGHGPKWKRVCEKVGAKPIRCVEFHNIPYRYVGVCPDCSFRFGFHRKIFEMEKRTCSDCKKPILWKDTNVE